ncbi:hypothetical protein D3C80_1746440 [compost metagenome]
MGELVEGAGDFPLGLDQQALGVARQLAGGEQLVGAEAVQFGQAGAQLLGQLRRQFGKRGRQVFQGLDRRAVLQRIAAGEVAEDIARRLPLELLGQAQVALHQQVGALQGALRPPEGGRQGYADGDQQQGIEVGK